MGLLYMSKCELEKFLREPDGVGRGIVYDNMCVDMCRKKSRTNILSRRCSRVYNVVTVQYVLSIILNIHRQTWCSVGRNPKNAIGSSLCGETTEDLFKFRLQDRDIYFEIKYSNQWNVE